MTDRMHKWLINIVFIVESHLTAAEGITQPKLMSRFVLLVYIDVI